MSTQAPDSIVITPTAVTNQNYIQAFEATLADRAALDPTELSPVYADVMSAASRADSAAKRAAKYDAVLATLPIPAGLRAKVSLYADAASYSHIAFVNADEAPPIVIPMIDELRISRDVLLADVKALVLRGRIAEKHLHGINGTTGFRAIAYDVMILCDAVIKAWPTIQNRTGGTLEEYQELRDRAERADKAVTQREDQEKLRTEAADARQRAFTLLVRAYEELRHALTFVLRHASAAELANAVPPLQNGRPRRVREEDEEEPADVAPVVGGNGSNGASNTAGFASGGSNSGLPGGSPFIDE